MVRSAWKIVPFFNFSKKNIKKKIKIYNSNFIITADLLGYIFFVYTGNKYIKIIVTKLNIGEYLSSLVITRHHSENIHLKKDKKRK